MIPGLSKVWQRFLLSAPIRAFAAGVAMVGKLRDLVAAGVEKIIEVRTRVHMRYKYLQGMLDQGALHLVFVS